MVPGGNLIVEDSPRPTRTDEPRSTWHKPPSTGYMGAPATSQSSPRIPRQGCCSHTAGVNVQVGMMGGGQQTVRIRVDIRNWANTDLWDPGTSTTPSHQPGRHQDQAGDCTTTATGQATATDSRGGDQRGAVLPSFQDWRNGAYRVICSTLPAWSVRRYGSRHRWS